MSGVSDGSVSSPPARVSLCAASRGPELLFRTGSNVHGHHRQRLMKEVLPRASSSFQNPHTVLPDGPAIASQPALPRAEMIRQGSELVFWKRLPHVGVPVTKPSGLWASFWSVMGSDSLARLL